MITTILAAIFGVTYLGANGLVWSGQNTDSFGKICANSNRDPLTWIIAAVLGGAAIAANIFL